MENSRASKRRFGMDGTEDDIAMTVNAKINPSLQDKQYSMEMESKG